MSAASPLRRLAAAHWPLAGVCALFLIVAVFTSDDYGYWVDTRHQQRYGNVALDYLAGDGERAFDRLAFPWDRYYGAAFEAPLALVERVLDLDPRDAIRVRHLLSHLFFLVGGAFCYLLVLRMFGSRPLAIVATVLFLLHPRIYAHSFFNSKDVPFLAAFMIALYLVHRAFRRDTLGAFLLCGVGVGLLVNLRIMGVVLFAAVLALRALDLAGRPGRALLTGAAFALAAVLTFYASLPALWTDPAGRLPDMFRALSSFPWEGFTLFRGEWLYSLDGPPFDYLPVWVGITTPPATLLLALTGALALAWSALRRPRDVIRNGPLRFGLLLALLPVALAVAVVALESNVYNGWRQLYFLYAPLLLLAAVGLHRFMAAARGRWPRTGTYALAGVAATVALVSLVRIHPHQDSYFTVLVDRTTPERLASRYQMDQFHLSHRAALADVVEDHPSGTIHVALPRTSLFSPSRWLLPPDDERRLLETNDFRSGERNFLGIDRSVCLASTPPRSTRAIRVYANTLFCMVEPAAWMNGLRGDALATEPLLRSVYDVYAHGRLLTYVREGCPREDVEAGGPRLFLHVTPVDPRDLPSWNRDHGFENLAPGRWGASARVDGDCVVSIALPDYPIAGIRTGQFTGDDVLWEAAVVFGEEAPDYAAARREALAGEPLARSSYDIHLDDRKLTYLREGCTDAEADARFFLHVLPTNEGDLPDHRREHGFDNLDFTLALRGARLDGDCVAVARLPAYPIATVRTGQYDDTGALWLVEFALPDGE